MDPSGPHYSVGEEKADELIEQLVEFCMPPLRGREYLREIFTTVTKLGLESRDIGDFKLVNTSLKELRYALKLFTPFREVRKAVVFGSARVPPEDPGYQMALRVSRRLAEAGWQIITGAGGGIMEAGNRGAGPGRSFGINIKLPFEQQANPYIEGDPKLMTFKYFFTRKLTFLKESDATVLFPGGFGTLDEGFETLTLFQTGKSLPRPIALVEPEGSRYWTTLLDFLDQELFRKHYLSRQDRYLYRLFHDVDAAVDWVLSYYKVYHSLRYVKELTVLRLHKTPRDYHLEAWNQEFDDLLLGGQIESGGALPDEIEKNEYPDLPRLILHFNKRSFGRLNELIQRINHDLGAEEN